MRAPSWLRMRTPPRFGMTVAVCVVAFDQALKAGVSRALPYPGSELTLTSFFNLVHVRNSGVGFGLFQGADPWLLSGFALMLISFLAGWLACADDRHAAAALGLTIGGAFGNVIDRICCRAVFDFLDFHAFGYHWPAFNAADSAITLGVAALLLHSLRETRRAAANKGA